MVCATALLNANSVPAASEAKLHAAARRLGIFLHHVESLPFELDAARTDFYRHLERNWVHYMAAVRKRPELEYIAFTDGLGYVARLHAILYELKAFLDLFTHLVCSLVSTEPGPRGFNKGKVDDRKLSGGRLINWLSGRDVHLLPHRDAIVGVLSFASRDWITNAVATRDTLGHVHDLPDFRHMRISVSHGPAIVSPADIQLPQMPDGRDLVAYSTHLRDCLCQLVSEVFPLVPGVKSDLNEKWGTAIRYLGE